MQKTLEIKGGLLARNTLFNLIGQGLPLVVAVVTIPLIIQGLGIDRFGLLSLAWVVLGYFAIFDLGLGRATTKFVAEALLSLSIPVVLVSSSFRGGVSLVAGMFILL
jgi:O-antigen/teichoic acid export membrane protein